MTMTGRNFLSIVMVDLLAGLVSSVMRVSIRGPLRVKRCGAGQARRGSLFAVGPIATTLLQRLE